MPVSASDVVHACVANSDRHVTNFYGRKIIVIPSGTTRIVAAAKSCKSWETPTSWNKDGAAGAAGVKGDKGDPGQDSSNSALVGTDTGSIGAGRGGGCTMGMIMPTASTYADEGTPASGQLLPINQNQALFALIGTVYGGNGVTNFALPSLQSLAPNNMTYTICTQAVFPSRN